MGAAGACDRRMSSGCHFYTRLTLVISRPSECMGFDNCPQRLSFPLDRYNPRCWTVSAGCRENSLSRVGPGLKEGRPYQSSSHNLGSSFKCRKCSHSARIAVVEWLKGGKSPQFSRSDPGLVQRPDESSSR